MRDGIYARKQTQPFKLILPQDCRDYKTVRDNTAARLQTETHEQRLNRLQTVRDNTADRNRGRQAYEIRISTTEHSSLSTTNNVSQVRLKAVLNGGNGCFM